MIRRPPRSTRTDTLFPYTTLVRSELEGKSLATGGSADKAIQAGRDIKLNDSTLKGYWTLPNGSIIAQGGARIEDATITANKTALKTSGSAPSITVRNSSLKSTGAGTGFRGLVTAVNDGTSGVVGIDGGKHGRAN